MWYGRSAFVHDHQCLSLMCFSARTYQTYMRWFKAQVFTKQWSSHVHHLHTHTLSVSVCVSLSLSQLSLLLCSLCPFLLRSCSLHFFTFPMNGVILCSDFFESHACRGTCFQETVAFLLTVGLFLSRHCVGESHIGRHVNCHLGC